MKMMMMVVVMAGMLIVAAGCATTDSAQTAAAEPAVSARSPALSASDAKDPDRIRCERMKVTGSRLGGKVCHTEAEWALINQRADELMHDIERTPIGFIGEGQHSLPPSRTSGSLADGL